ncbi:Heterogeneous nuclear ribonucleoprotein M [Cricetulus griseus]|uniref:Heterogeneous nuclear ribonucleoprotein M n=1 Tax=Cricetulus griseus TaxID=10029 RepID=G3I9J9_CRIGR|nr:Heterogeneous nuclear ribonucleoprotein M [Cricetulus griseus]
MGPAIECMGLSMNRMVPTGLERMGLERLGANSLERMGLERMGANSLEHMGPAMGPALGAGIEQMGLAMGSAGGASFDRAIEMDRATLEEASQVPLAELEAMHLE